jgi:ribosome-associated toxin RatA of RatAB toxin-antitoxin module
MKHVKKSVLLWYSPREIYDLVVAVPAYPQFLPWCQRAEVLAQGADEVTARLHLSYAGVRHAFTTRNTHVLGESVTMGLVDGPFSHLEGVWRFLPIGTPAAATPGAGAQACRVEFELAYAFSSRPLELVVSPVFDRIANTFVDAFVSRAEQVHGKR